MPSPWHDQSIQINVDPAIHDVPFDCIFQRKRSVVVYLVECIESGYCVAQIELQLPVYAVYALVVVNKAFHVTQIQITQPKSPVPVRCRQSK